MVYVVVQKFHVYTLRLRISKPAECEKLAALAAPELAVKVRDVFG